MRVFRLIAFALLFALPALVSQAENVAPVSASVDLSLASGNTVALTGEMLAALPQVERDVTFQTSKGPSSGRYKGPLLWDVLTSNKVFEGLEHNAELAQVFVVRGRDGYRIAFSVGEIHPDFGKAPMMVATEVDGKPFADSLRVIVPGDTRGARNVRDVVAIELQQAK